MPKVLSSGLLKAIPLEKLVKVDLLDCCRCFLRGCCSLEVLQFQSRQSQTGHPCNLLFHMGLMLGENAARAPELTRA